MKKLVVLLCMSVFLFACSTDEAVEDLQQTTETQDVTKEGRANTEAPSEILEFGSFEELENFIRALQDSDTDLLDEARSMSEERNYHSLLFIYETDLAQLDEVGIKIEDVAIVNSFDDMLHLLLNQDGEIKVGNQIYRIDGEFVYQYIEGTGDQIAQFLENYNAGDIRIEKGDSRQISEELLVYRHNNNENIEEELERGVTHYDYFTGGDFRMKSRQFNGFWWFYSSIGSSTKIQKKKRYWFFGWRTRWDTVKRYNRLEYEMSYTANGIGIPSYTNSAGGFEYCHCNIARDTYDWSVGVPFAPFYYTPNAGSGQSVHWAHEFSVTPNTEHRTINY